MAVQNLRVTFGTVTAVRDVSFHVDEGEIVVIAGPNGAGKTTTTETLLGFRRPTSGSVSIFGHDPVAQHRLTTRLVGALLQRGGVWAPVSPRRVIDLTASYYDTARPTDELLERLGLTGVADTPWRRLSGGEQQRTLFALALVGRPRGLILDEPTAAVDPEGHHIIGGLLRELRDDGLAIAVTTHQLADAEQFADRVVILTHGEVAAAGSLDALRTQQLTVFELSTSVDIDALSLSVGCPVENDGPNRYRIVGTSITPGDVDRAVRGLGAELVSVRTRATLEERYLDIVREAQSR